MKHITGDLYSRFGGRAVFKGGGGGSSTSTSGYTPGMQKIVENKLAQASRFTDKRLADPNLSVAALTPEQRAALSAQTNLGLQAISGTGIYDTEDEVQRMLRNVEGRTALGQAGTGGMGALSSARSEKARQAAMGDQAFQYAQERQRVADLGVKNLGAAGTTYQQQDQASLDAPREAMTDFFGWVTGAAPKQTTTTQSGGGK